MLCVCCVCVCCVCVVCVCCVCVVCVLCVCVVCVCVVCVLCVCVVLCCVLCVVCGVWVGGQRENWNSLHYWLIFGIQSLQQVGWFVNNSSYIKNDLKKSDKNC